MFKLNGADIGTSGTSPLMAVEDRLSDVVKAYSNMKYAKPYFSTPVVQYEQFKLNGVSIQFAPLGGRPRFNLRASYGAGAYSFSVSGDKILVNGTELTDASKSKTRLVICELIGAGGGGSGGNALLSGCGGGSGAYAVFIVDFQKTNQLVVTVGAGGAQAPNRGQASAGGNSDVRQSNSSQNLLSCGGGGGGYAGDIGVAGVFTNSIGDASYIQLLFGVNGLSGTTGVGEETSSCPQSTLTVGFEEESANFKRLVGGHSITSTGGGAGVGGSSQFGAGGKDGVGGSYDGKSPDSTAYGAGGGGGHGRAFSQSNGGNGVDGILNIYW